MDKQALQRSIKYHQQREENRRAAREQLRNKRYWQVRSAICNLAPNYPALNAVYLYGSLLRSGGFGLESDIDIAVSCADKAEESLFWQALEAELEWDVDLRSYTGAVAWAVDSYGECIYARKIPGTGTDSST